MFNVGGGEFLVIFLVALIVLGPAKLPEVARQVGGFMREIRKVSSGFQDEMRAAMDDPIEAAARERGNQVRSSEQRPAPDADVGDELDDDDDDPDFPDGNNRGDGDDRGDDIDHDDDLDDDEDGPPPLMSTAEAAGMYAVAPPANEPTSDEPAPEVIDDDPSMTPNPYLAPVGTRATADDVTEPDDVDSVHAVDDDDDDAVGHIEPDDEPANHPGERTQPITDRNVDAP